MSKLSVFQIVLIAIFALGATAGLIFFGTFRGSPDKEFDVGSVTIWGVVNGRAMSDIIGRIKTAQDGFNSVEYVEKDPRTFERELVNALAAGAGPDLFLLSQDQILLHEDKVTLIPFGSYSERTFKDTFIEEGELFLTNDGLYGLPFIVDPMVMYWNRDMLTAKGIASPPTYWDELFDLGPRITERDQASNILKSAVALGEFRNIRHAKEILSTLIMQAGNPIVVSGKDNQPESVLTSNSGFSTRPADAALRFYTEFSNPVKSVYSWNRALPESRASFLSGDLAIYFGFAGEYQLIRNANPNLNFDIASMPQSRDTSARVTFGEIAAFAVPKGSDNVSGAFRAATILTSHDVIADVARATGLPPVRRDLLSIRPADAIGSVLYDAALVSSAWLDPNPQETEEIFQRMVESTISGRSPVSEAVSTARLELSQLLK